MGLASLPGGNLEMPVCLPSEMHGGSHGNARVLHGGVCVCGGCKSRAKGEALGRNEGWACFWAPRSCDQGIWVDQELS